VIEQTPEGRRAFILDSTELQRPPHVPELSLYLASEMLPIWRMTEEALETLGLPPPFWAFAWAGGQALARYVLDNPQLVAGQRVLDFASGSGIVGVAAAKAGAAEVLCADIDPFCGAAATLNAAANGVTLATTEQNLLDALPPRDADVILAGDICYEAPLADQVMAWLAAAKAQGAAVLVGDPGRSYFPKERFEKLAEYQVPTTRELEDMEVRRTAVWALP
jgi:predicted nicotinamide N-methyase